MMKITQDEIRSVQKFFPALDLNADRTKIVGELSFSAYYDGRKLHLDPKEAPKNKVFGGCYEIEIRLNDLDPYYGLPKVCESGGKILQFAAMKKIKPMDLHLNIDANGTDYYCCIGIFTTEEIQKMTLYTFVVEYIFSFFAWQAYRSRFLTTPPWGEYTHSQQGIFEKRAEVLKKTGRNDPCPCGSGKKFKLCCLYKYKISGIWS